MTIYASEPRQIKEAAERIRMGQVVAFPTETVYGLGADAFNEKAVAQIFEIKNRPYFDPLIVHISEMNMLHEVAINISSASKKIMEIFWPGPLTLIFEKKKNISDLVTSGLSTVAVRMPSHPIALELIRQAKTPIAAPSANPFGYLSPTCAAHVEKQLGDKVDYILDGGNCSTGIESTILDLTAGSPSILRLGGMDYEKIEDLLGEVKIQLSSSRPKAPGQLESHYAPRTPIEIIKSDYLPHDAEDSGLLALTSTQLTQSFKSVEILSAQGDLVEAASHFFSALHRLDQKGLAKIYAFPLPEKGLGRAMMDRLKRACR
jgi:L-threonylcarbamoyladenylate synthase